MWVRDREVEETSRHERRGESREVYLSRRRQLTRAIVGERRMLSGGKRVRMPPLALATRASPSSDSRLPPLKQGSEGPSPHLRLATS